MNYATQARFAQQWNIRSKLLSQAKFGSLARNLSTLLAQISVSPVTHAAGESPIHPATEQAAAETRAGGVV